jgi:dihydrofolate reductase
LPETVKRPPAGLVDELHIDIMPVLLGAGLRFFADGGRDRLALEKIDVQDMGVRTSLKFRIKKEDGDGRKN